MEYKGPIKVESEKGKSRGEQEYKVFDGTGFFLPQLPKSRVSGHVEALLEIL